MQNSTNQTDIEYIRLLDLILKKGRLKKNRTGVDTLGVFGAQARFNLQDGFPILTTKKIYFRSVIHELLWFISGSTNIKYLVDNDVHIWDEWGCKRWMEKTGAKGHPNALLPIYLRDMKADPQFAEQWGELGEGTYGGMWRDFPIFLEHKDYYHQAKQHVNFKYEAEGCVSMYGIDQISKIIDKLKSNPDDRRLIVSAWHPYWVDHCALPPCHCLFQFHTEELTLEERWVMNQKMVACKTNEAKRNFLDGIGMPTRRLNCQLYQRSCDTFLGVPFNISSYSLLLAMVAHCVNMVPGEFIHTYGDLHIYTNHLDQVNEQLKRKPMYAPKLWLNPEVKDLFKFKFEDIRLDNYQSHPAIKAEIAV